MLVASGARNLERLHAGADSLFEDDVAIEIQESEHAASLALDGNPVLVERVEVQSRYFRTVSDGVYSGI